MKSKYQINKWIIYTSIIFFFIVFLILPIVTRVRVDENQHYESKNEVALYIYEYEHLPLNFITKDQSVQMFGTHIDAVENGYNIGGDVFNYVGVITSLTNKTTLFECDIYEDRILLVEQNLRGTHRLVYSDDGEEVYFTENHYDSFSKILKFDIQILSNILWVIFVGYIVCMMLYFRHLFIMKFLDRDIFFNDIKQIGFQIIKVILIVPYFVFIWVIQNAINLLNSKAPKT